MENIDKIDILKKKKIDILFWFIFINQFNGMKTQSVKYVFNYCFLTAVT